MLGNARKLLVLGLFTIVALMAPHPLGLEASGPDNDVVESSRVADVDARAEEHVFVCSSDECRSPCQCESGPQFTRCHEHDGLECVCRAPFQ